MYCPVCIATRISVGSLALSHGAETYHSTTRMTTLGRQHLFAGRDSEIPASRGQSDSEWLLLAWKQALERRLPRRSECLL